MNPQSNSDYLDKNLILEIDNYNEAVINELQNKIRERANVGYLTENPTPEQIKQANALITSLSLIIELQSGMIGNLYQINHISKIIEDIHNDTESKG